MVLRVSRVGGYSDYISLGLGLGSLGDVGYNVYEL
jgi:hypothetical protein